jgi:glycosyltransferase involved in cell wall biosynthesis
VPKEKCVYIRNAVDLTEVDEFLAQKETNAQKLKKQIGFIGQMIPRKNIKDAIDVFNQLWLKNNNIEFLLLGEGESRLELENYANSLPSNTDIKFLGFRNDRMAILKELDLFVMTSKDEGIPRCLMEACAMEIPIAAYDISGIDQLITHQKTGLLAKFGDKETLAKYWDILLNDTEVAKKLSQASRVYVQDKFSGQRMAKEYLELFKRLITNK